MSNIEEFVERHWGLALWVARRRTVQAAWRGDPDEVQSDAVLGLWNAARTFAPDRGSTAPAWARRHVENAITDGLRRRHGEARYAHGRSGWTHVPWDERDDHRVAPDPASQVINRVDIARAIARLEPRERLALSRWLYDGVPLHRIGADLGVTESRASQIVTTARRRLQRALRVPDEHGPHLRIPRWWGPFVRCDEEKPHRSLLT